jgi:lipopolysaccharide biosynthesis glycosyltransferase
VTHESNQGLHLARKTGVEHASGDYAFFLDGDDAIAPDFCKELASEIAGHPADILHFGLDVVGSNGILESECQAFEAFNNAPTDDAAGEDILRNIFDPERGQQVDWRVTQRLMRTELLKSAFGAMTGERLERAEDGYECFVISALASSYRSFKQCRGYIYHYGRGVTGTNEISSEPPTPGSARSSRPASMPPATSRSSTASHGRGNRCLASSTRPSSCSPTIGTCACPTPRSQRRRRPWPRCSARRSPRARSTASCATARTSSSTPKSIPRRTTTAFRHLAIARSFTDLDPRSSDFGRYVDEGQGRGTYDQLQSGIRTHQRHERQSTRIFVTSHKRADMPASDILQMVQVGPGNTTDRFLDAFHDDTGDNISAKNPMYCELTTQYWAWKNAKADYYGFCHYRRYFDFSDVEHEENPYGEIMDDYIDAEATAKYGLDDDAIAKSIAGYDVVTTGIKDLRGIINGLGTPKAVWAAAPYLLNRDLRHVYDILCAMHPDYAKDANDFLDGHYSCFCNMFIMKKDIFFDYCAWLFPILEEFERTTDMSRYSKEALRTPGHLSERLLNIYLMHHKRIGSGWKTKELQCVHFTNPEPEHVLEPLQGVKDPSTIIPVVFAADNNYVPMLTTTIYSAMKNADPKRRYDVTVLQKDIDGQNQQTMREFFSRFSNMNLRFVNVDRKIAGYDLSTNNQHISNETYYRFLIQEILPFYSKVLYLDSDIIVTGDIAALYDTELGDNLLAACRDIDYLGNLNIKIDNKRIAYSKDILGMRNPYDYFQAGVLVLNTAAMRSHYSIGQWLEYASNPDFIYNDQDVLNVHCEGKVTFLDWNWDVIHDCDGRVAKVFSFAPNDIYDAYMRSRQDPKIIHYAGFIKPWVDPACDFASVYWDYARDTPFYERLIKRVAESIVPNAMRLKAKKHQPALNDSNPLRRVIDPIAPLGSKRREAMKAAGRLVRGRK